MRDHAFLVLRENQFAFTAAMKLRTQVARGGASFVTVYGPAGSGKSHLARQLIRDTLKHNPSAETRHLTATELAAQLAEASVAGRIRQFQERYRNDVHLFVCEDLPAISGRTETQQQLLAIIDHVLEHRGRVLLTATSPPGEWDAFQPKIVNRCHGGVCAEIEPLSKAGRTKLWEHLAQAQQLPLPTAIIDDLASEGPSSPREMLAFLLQLRHAASTTRAAIDQQLVRTLLKDQPTAIAITISDVSKLVAKQFGVRLADLRGASRTQNIAMARQTAMLLTRELTGANYVAIGEYFSGRNHSTVLHACDRVREAVQSDPKLSALVGQVRESLRRGRYQAE